MTKKIEIQLNLSVEARNGADLGEPEIPYIYLFPAWAQWAEWVNAMFKVHVLKHETTCGMKVLMDGEQNWECSTGSAKRHQEQLAFCAQKRYSCSRCSNSEGPGLDCRGNPGLEFFKIDRQDESLEDTEGTSVPDYCVQNDGDCQTCSLKNYSKDCQNNPIKRSATDQEGESGRTGQAFQAAGLETQGMVDVNP